MTHQTRRTFLSNTVKAGGALALAQTAGISASAEDTPANMSIAKWAADPVADADAAAFKSMAVKLTEQAMNAVGGMKRFVKKGDVVWVKPNIAWDRPPELAANTNPDVVATLVKMCLDAGAKTVKVGDRPCSPAQKSYSNSGIEAAAKEAGGEVVYLDENRFREMDLKGEYLSEWEIYPEIIETDLVINCPIAKHHGLTQATLCMKNYMGVVGGRRNAWHQALPACLTDITRFMKPRLSVLDAIRILTANGPQSSKIEDVARQDTIAVSTDVLALEAFGVEMLGNKPEARQIVEKAAAADLGNPDYKSLNPKEIAVS
ncbi:MAG: DUF362 domain-containing protein [Candidatus Hydrogenedentota bacterium]